MKTLLKLIVYVFVIQCLVLNVKSDEMDEIDETEVSDSEMGDLDEGGSVNLMEKLEQDKIKRIGNQFKREQTDEEVDDKLEYFAGLNVERDSWLYENKHYLVNLTLGMIVVSLIVLISWKMYSINQLLIKQNENVNLYAEEMEKMIEHADQLKYITWKDQKEGILFIQNPLQTEPEAVDGGDPDAFDESEEILQQQIKKLMNGLERKNDELDKLKEKEIQYLKLIEDLNKEYDANKKRILDEGAGAGIGEGILKEFK